AYFSRAGENYHYGSRVDLDVGNTQVLAEMLAGAVSVDVFRIVAADPYPHDYDQTVARNLEEEQDDARPRITGDLPDLGGYDTILLGSPVWNSQPPMIMRTFIDALDWTGKTVQPFVTYAVSRMGAVQRDYTQWCQGATVGDGLAIQGETVNDARDQTEDWLRQIKLV
ncbi:MAG: hypothetical protein B7X41_02435, partial [Microbacterium sp. 14-71-5]